MKMTRLESITAIIISLAILCMGLVSAYPYQLNLTDGSIIDLNSSDNSTNFTVYIVHIYTNVSSNVTYINQTCFNCTYINQSVSNISQSNITYVAYASYNKSEIDDKINSVDSALRLVVADKSPQSNLDAVSSRVSAIEDKKVNTSGHFWLWAVIIILLLAIGYLIYLGAMQ